MESVIVGGESLAGVTLPIVNVGLRKGFELVSDSDSRWSSFDHFLKTKRLIYFGVGLNCTLTLVPKDIY